MKRFLLLSLTLFIFQISFAQSKDETKVKECFQSYKEAILAGNGEDAAKCVDQHTLEYYSMVLEKSLTADSSEVVSMPFMDKFMVLVVRYRLESEDLKEMDGREFFIYAIDNDMVGKNSVMNVELGEVKVEGKFAQAGVLSRGVDAGFTFDFYKEKRKWKMDLTSLFGPTSVALKSALESKEMTEEDFILFSLELTGKKSVSENIWYPTKSN